HLKIMLRAHELSTSVFNENAARLLVLVQKMTRVSRFTFELPEIPETAGLGASWWRETMTGKGREGFVHLLSLPSLRHLDIEGIEIPSTWSSRHPKLETLRVWDSFCLDPSESNLERPSWPRLRALTIGRKQCQSIANLF